MSRERILENIRRNKPIEQVVLPEMPIGTTNIDSSILDLFTKMVEEVSGKVIAYTSFNIDQLSNKRTSVYSTVADLYKGNVILENADSKDLEKLDVAILEGAFAVAENGAIWLPEENMGGRIIPFITKNLVLVLDKSQIVLNMHEAYNRLGRLNTGFGVFISGPSKTADIEQSLVIGAQGHLSLTVVLK